MCHSTFKMTGHIKTLYLPCSPCVKLDNCKFLSITRPNTRYIRDHLEWKICLETSKASYYFITLVAMYMEKGDVEKSYF